MINSTSIVAQIINVSKGRIELPAIDFNDSLVTYRQFLDFYKQFENFLKEFNLNKSMRVGVVGLQKEIIYSASLAIIENAIFITLENNKGSLVDSVELYDLDCIFIGEANKNLYEEILKNNSQITVVTCKLVNSEIIFNVLQESMRSICELEDNNDFCIITSTSGTTSVPKLIPRSYNLLLNICEQFRNVYKYNSSTVHMQSSPYDRSVTITNVIYVLYSGGMSVIISNDLKAIIKNLERYKKIIYRTVPSNLESILRVLESEQKILDYNVERIITVGGAKLTSELYNSATKYFSCNIVHTYGISEAGYVASSFNAPYGYKEGAVGIILNHEVKIIDSEILLKGPTVFTGYLNYPNEDVFVDGWFKTGDIGEIDSDGYLKIEGRIKEMINRGGEKISPYELEDFIMSMGHFKEVVVFPFLTKNAIELVGVVVVTKDNIELDINIELIRKFLQDKVSSFKLPSFVLVKKDIPKNLTTGKVERNRLKDFYVDELSEKQETYNSTENSNVVEDKIIEIVKKILKLKSVRLDDDFVALGGDSLNYAELCVALESEFGIEINLSNFVKQNKVRDIIELTNVAELSTRKLKYLVKLKEGNPNLEPLIFCHAPSGSAVTYQYIVNYLDTDRPVYGLVFNYKNSNWSYPFNANEILNDYVSDIKKLQKVGPFYFAGSSMGGRIALELSNILSRENKIGMCALFDTVFEPKPKNRIILTIISVRKQFFDMNVYKLKYLSLIISKIKNYFLLMLPTRHKDIFFLANMSEKIYSKSYSLTHAEMSALTRSSLKKELEEFYDFDCLYLHAKKSHNEKSIDKLRSISKSVNVHDLNCYHGQFVDIFSKQTAKILERYL